MNKKNLLIISCGGTGGHFFPGMSLAREWKLRGREVRLSIAGKHIPEQLKHAEDNHIDADPAFAVALPQQKYKLPIWGILFFISVIRAVFYLIQHRPKAVLVMGSFASVPLGFAATLCGIPLFLHEGNTVCGRANSTLSRWARCLFTSFPLASTHSINCPTFESGLPLRDSFYSAALEEKGNAQLRQELKLPATGNIILAFGGSLGARIINNTLPLACEGISADKFTIIHLCGNADPLELEANYKKSKVDAIVIKSVSNMVDYYKVADVVISRAGASSLAELALMGKCTISIPFKKAADQHQLRNAEFFAKNNALTVITEDELNCETLTESLNKLLLNKTERQDFENNISALAKADAPSRLTEDLIKKIS